MKIRAHLFLAALFLVSVCAHAEQPPAEAEFEPTVGQSGKDVVWVPTPDTLVTEMLTMAKTTPKDFVIDLGSGDGKIAIAAAKEFGAPALGIEYNPDMVTLSNRNAQKAGVADKVQFIKADIFESDFSKATVITMYLLPRLNMQLRPKLLQLKPGTRLVSHAFGLEDWKPDQTARMESREAFLWIVPAQIGGEWKVSAGDQQMQLSLKQKFQTFAGRARVGDTGGQITEGKLNGEELRFVLRETSGATREFTGRVKGKQMEGVAQSGQQAPLKWTATRTSKVQSAEATTQ